MDRLLRLAIRVNGHQRPALGLFAAGNAERYGFGGQKQDSVPMVNQGSMQVAAEDDFHTILLQEMIQVFSWFRLSIEIIAARFIQVFEEEGIMHKQNSRFARRPCEFALEEVPHFLLQGKTAAEQ